jgi:hypothetical protein
MDRFDTNFRFRRRTVSVEHAPDPIIPIVDASDTIYDEMPALEDVSDSPVSATHCLASSGYVKSDLSRVDTKSGRLALLGVKWMVATKALVTTTWVGCNHLTLYGCIHYPAWTCPLP